MSPVNHVYRDEDTSWFITFLLACCAVIVVAFVLLAFHVSLL